MKQCLGELYFNSTCIVLAWYWNTMWITPWFSYQETNTENDNEQNSCSDNNSDFENADDLYHMKDDLSTMASAIDCQE